jgi:hypothetical protein
MADQCPAAVLQSATAHAEMERAAPRPPPPPRKSLWRRPRGAMTALLLAMAAQRLAAPRRRGIRYGASSPGDPDMSDPISAHQASLTRPHETADQYVERDLLSVENERLRREVASLRSALRAANRITSPYADERPRNGLPPRR